MYLQRLIHESRYGRFMVCEHRWQRNVAFEVADFDNHFVAFFGHDDFIHFDVWEWQAEDVGVPVLDDFLDGATVKDLTGILLTKDGGG